MEWYLYLIKSTVSVEIALALPGGETADDPETVQTEFGGSVA